MIEPVTPSSQATSGASSIVMITQDVEVTRRILQEARTLTDAGWAVRIITRSADEKDHAGTVDGLPVEWVAVRGRDRRFRWLYKLAGMERGSQATALWSVLTGKHTFTMRATGRAIAANGRIYHAHDLNNLQVAYTASRRLGAKLVYDAHELFPEMGNRWVRLKRGSWRRLEKKLLPRTDLSITVNELIAEEMSKRYNVAPPLVVLNCPDPPPGFDAGARHDRLREQLGLPAESKIVLYQGWMSEGRGLENLVRSARLLVEGAVVVFMGYGEYEGALRKMAAAEPEGRIHFIPAVPQRALLAYCASADVGVIPYQAVDLNNYYTSPNKLFDFIQAGLPIVASDLPYLRKVVVGEGVGVVARLDSPQAYADSINAVLRDEGQVEEMRGNLRRAAPSYTWAAQGRKLAAAYEKLR